MIIYEIPNVLYLEGGQYEFTGLQKVSDWHYRKITIDTRNPIRYWMGLWTFENLWVPSNHFCDNKDKLEEIVLENHFSQQLAMIGGELILVRFFKDLDKAVIELRNVDNELIFSKKISVNSDFFTNNYEDKWKILDASVSEQYALLGYENYSILATPNDIQIKSCPAKVIEGAYKAEKAWINDATLYPKAIHNDSIIEVPSRILKIVSGSVPNTYYLSLVQWLGGSNISTLNDINTGQELNRCIVYGDTGECPGDLLFFRKATTRQSQILAYWPYLTYIPPEPTSFIEPTTVGESNITTEQIPTVALGFADPVTSPSGGDRICSRGNNQDALKEPTNDFTHLLTHQLFDFEILMRIPDVYDKNCDPPCGESVRCYSLPTRLVCSFSKFIVLYGMGGYFRIPMRFKPQEL